MDGVETCDVGEPGDGRDVQYGRQQDRQGQRGPAPVDEGPRQRPPAQVRPAAPGGGHTSRRLITNAVAAGSPFAAGVRLSAVSRSRRKASLASFGRRYMVRPKLVAIEVSGCRLVLVIVRGQLTVDGFEEPQLAGGEQLALAA